jgi:hypothetical protein
VQAPDPDPLPPASESFVDTQSRGVGRLTQALAGPFDLVDRVNVARSMIEREPAPSTGTVPLPREREGRPPTGRYILEVDLAVDGAGGVIIDMEWFGPEWESYRYFTGKGLAT